jgi:hypothetical protein
MRSFRLISQNQCDEDGIMFDPAFDLKWYGFTGEITVGDDNLVPGRVVELRRECGSLVCGMRGRALRRPFPMWKR